MLFLTRFRAESNRSKRHAPSGSFVLLFIQSIATRVYIINNLHYYLSYISLRRYVKIVLLKHVVLMNQIRNFMFFIYTWGPPAYAFQTEFASKTHLLHKY